MTDLPPDSDMFNRNQPSAWFADLRATLVFLTRFPVEAGAGDLARATRVFPVVGALVGLVGGIGYAVALELALPRLLAAALAVGLTILITGALHEDGLADSADGFGGGRDEASRLAIMKDSRTGAFGVLALGLSLIARVAALSALGAGAGVAALIAAHALARGVLPMAMARGRLAREDGLAVSAGRPRESDALLAAGLGALIGLFALGFGAGLVPILATGLVAIGVMRFARRRIGGYTGDLLGTVEQLCEIAVLAVAASAVAR